MAKLDNKLFWNIKYGKLLGWEIWLTSVVLKV